MAKKKPAAAKSPPAKQVTYLREDAPVARRLPNGILIYDDCLLKDGPSVAFCECGRYNGLIYAPSTCDSPQEIV